MTLKICVESLPSLASPLLSLIQTNSCSSAGAGVEVVVGADVAVVVDDGDVRTGEAVVVDDRAGVDAAEQANFPDTQSPWPSTRNSKQD